MEEESTYGEEGGFRLLVVRGVGRSEDEEVGFWIVEVSAEGRGRRSWRRRGGRSFASSFGRSRVRHGGDGR